MAGLLIVLQSTILVFCNFCICNGQQAETKTPKLVDGLGKEHAMQLDLGNFPREKLANLSTEQKRYDYDAGLSSVLIRPTEKAAVLIPTDAKNFKLVMYTGLDQVELLDGSKATALDTIEGFKKYGIANYLGVGEYALIVDGKTYNFSVA